MADIRGGTGRIDPGIMKKLIAGIGVIFLLAGCHDPHKNQHCVRSHVSHYWTMQCGMWTTAGCRQWFPIERYINHCDEWAANVSLPTQET